ncbi:OFA family MFS transporter [Streptomyces spectabilis]|uniref:MFS family permease n=2 Tax=Streptomyces spectabilis TaxID=68270 RepID=A0A7W8AZ44_STRST|nr:OFA family MFS transporter [Streptomyces spectabilis]MBB5107102.1 MFS family permease [Streptomyces spectabilis]MCI3906150.1 OFA family MFS transporter [Streptomyces spectabilis]GGV04577.1 MFS transporter [Streptomyces spectabilis]
MTAEPFAEHSASGRANPHGPDAQGPDTPEPDPHGPDPHGSGSHGSEAHGSAARGRDAPERSYRELTDARGRVYRVGESDRQILGRPRWTMVVLPWVAMIAISVFEYAYGAAEDTLSEAHHWTSSNTFWVLSVWIFFQAGVSFPAGKLREKGILTSRAAMLTGSVLSLFGFVSLSHAPNVAAAMVGFGLLGGVGSGLIYSTCVNMVGKWYPERRGGKTGFVNGGFAYGAVPFIFLFSYGFDTSNYRTVLDLVGFYVLAVTLVAGLFFKDPPKNWWPESVDPLRQGAGTRTAVALAKNPPAVAQFTPGEALRTGVVPLMWVCMLCCAGVSIFGISFQVPFAKEMGFGPMIAASSMGVMSVINGTGRGVVGWLSDRLGRRPTLTYVCVALSVAQFGVLWAGEIRNEPLFLVFAFLSGFAGGAFYPLFAALVPDYFGENNNASNYGMVYSAKLVSGLFGGGIGATVVHSWGYVGAYTTAGAVSLLAAGLSLLLQQPSVPRARGELMQPG